MPFPSELREKLLLWSDRHCCICKKQCGIFIELHHIVPKKKDGKDDEDNAIPLCFDCHGLIEHYNDSHPKGTKYRINEIKKRRNQIYDEFTRHLCPPIDCRISQENNRRLPDVGFTIGHPGGTPPVKIIVKVEPYVNYEKVNEFNNPIYQGKMPWNLNPQTTFHGHFEIPHKSCSSATHIAIGVVLSIQDCYERIHDQLPFTYVYDRDVNDWWLDPFHSDASAARLKEENAHT